MEGGRQQVAAGVNVANVSSGVVGKRSDRSDRVQNVDLGTARAGWGILPPRDRVEKRSAFDKVAGLSGNSKRWVGMVRKARKGAATLVNTQKKRSKKGYVDCWDILDAVGDLPVSSAREAEECKCNREGSSFLGGVWFPKT